MFAPIPTSLVAVHPRPRSPRRSRRHRGADGLPAVSLLLADRLLDHLLSVEPGSMDVAFDRLINDVARELRAAPEHADTR